VLILGMSSVNATAASASSMALSKICAKDMYKSGSLTRVRKQGRALKHCWSRMYALWGVILVKAGRGMAMAVNAVSNGIFPV